MGLIINTFTLYKKQTKVSFAQVSIAVSVYYCVIYACVARDQGIKTNNIETFNCIDINYKTVTMVILLPFHRNHQERQ
jgi:hypothetical protein